MRLARTALRATHLPVADAAAPDATAWDALFASAAAPNPHVSRHVMAAHGAAGLLPPSLRFVTVQTGGRLVALLPCAPTWDLSGLGARVMRPFLSPFVTATAPLIADGPERAAHAHDLVEALEAASGGRAWRWPLLPTEEGAVPEMLAAMRARGWALGTVAAFDRPVMDRRADHDTFLADHPSRSRFKDLRRRARRLAETGAVAFESATTGADLARLVGAFLDLERAGWKGQAGTAMACRPETQALAHALFADGPGPVRIRADALTVDGRPISVSLALVAGGTATLLKTAYDEELRSHAPGLLLEAEIVRACHQTGFAERLDSATLEGSALESLYRDRTPIAEIIALPPGGHALSLERRLRLAQFERQARATAKRALRRH
ncbi:Acetyltransferase involved in cellulose biosynthesis, CelD/BcsL family [Methylobacterium phyllostachyos]|uniref:Acetyltransferase involved in cellulose biosynthesis, CelD/BcsL family n=1 Tax=Methylobacterium phyllostachyos TaxID=582672 RepID=A0A1H0FZT7_9HYPH|nr:GNAT family N-acetyltransferase [Methylobacterium phyllostachyos]SDO00188.1 Acetyltransferase involved in cellulose biosynthesis, CelD/BcsL family [Methylobacterium phyllostachyos]